MSAFSRTGLAEIENAAWRVITPGLPELPATVPARRTVPEKGRKDDH
jgi:hypothetical protein